jgi:hypothetical protein
MFQHDREGALSALRTIGETDADVLLPGHGPAHHGQASTAADEARRAAT